MEILSQDIQVESTKGWGLLLVGLKLQEKTHPAGNSLNTKFKRDLSTIECQLMPFLQFFLVVVWVGNPGIQAGKAGMVQNCWKGRGSEKEVLENSSPG